MEPVHYLLCEPGPDQGTLERVRDIAAACPQPLHVSASLVFAPAAATGTSDTISTGPAASDSSALQGAGPPVPAAAAL